MRVEKTFPLSINGVYHGSPNEQITQRFRGPLGHINWLSPLQEDEYAEYYDRNFIKKLDIKLAKKSLESFWPISGPRWDGLGKTNEEKIFLVEAKSHIKEMISSSHAKCPSLAKIRSSLDKTKQFVGSKSSASIDWTTGTYQYANRLAHLYLLQILNDLDTYLILLYFLGDEEMKGPNTYVPTTQSEWESVIVYQERLMGIRQRHGLSDRIIHTFIDVKDIQVRV